MEVTGEAVFLEETTRRDDLDVDQAVVLAYCLAEERRFPAPDQRLEAGLTPGTVDLDLKVTTTCGTDPVVGRSAVRGGARVGRRGGQRKRTSRRGGDGGRRYPTGHEATAVEHRESVATQAPRGRGAPHLRQAASEAPGATSFGSVGLCYQVSAGNVDRCDGPQLFILLERLPKVDSLCVPEEPCAVVVFIAFEGGDPYRDIECAALAPKAATRGRRTHE